jgi:glycosyltransferase involved in cell wall biosynthesis
MIGLMKTILFLSHSASRTGAPLLLRDIASLLDKRKYNPVFILGEDGPLADDFKKIGPVHIDSLYPDELKYWREIKRAGKRIQLLRKIRPDVLYCNTIHPAKWLVYARLLRIPTIVHVHELSMGFATLTPVEHWLVKNYSGTVIAVSEAVSRYLVGKKNFDQKKIHIIRAGTKPEKFSVDSSRRKTVRSSLGVENDIVVGTVGRITYMKGSDIFLELAHCLRLENNSLRYKFLVIGSKEEESCYRKFKEDIGKFGLKDNVILLEDIKDVSPYYGAMDIFVSTAREDPFPLVVLEAMASGLPVVGFSVGGIPEAVTESCGILIPLLDIAAMVDQISRLSSNPRRMAEMGNAGAARIREKFSLMKNVNDIERIIDSAVEGHRPNNSKVPA